MNMTKRRRPSPPAVTGGALLISSGAAAAVTSALVVRVTAELPPVPRVDELVGRGVLVAGVLAAGWLACWCLVAALCIGARGIGVTWRRGERAVHRFAPAVVRRALGVGVAATMAVGLATGAGAVQPAGDQSPADGMSIGSGSSVPALGWSAARGPGLAPDHGPGLGTGPETGRSSGASRSTGASRGSVLAVDDLGWGANAAATDAEASPAATSTAAADHGRVTPPPTSTPDPSARPTAHRSPEAAAGSDATTAVALDSPPAQPAAAPERQGKTTGSPQPSSTAPAGPRDAGRAPTTAPRASHPEAVVVTRGDTLWSIAAEHLPADAAPDDVAAAWPDWYEANAALIGADPDHIEPGQRLAVPATTDDAPRGGTR
jgi:resuscitation-promoting factor RpfA